MSGRATTETSPTLRNGIAVPPLDLGTKPQHGSARTQVEHRPGHVGITRLVLAYGIPLCETEDVSHSVRIDQVIDEDSTGHVISLHG